MGSDFDPRSYPKIGDVDRAADWATENSTITRTKRKKRRYKLEKLIGEITEANRDGETRWGPPVGGEVW